MQFSVEISILKFIPTETCIFDLGFPSLLSPQRYFSLSLLKIYFHTKQEERAEMCELKEIIFGCFKNAGWM